MRLHYLTILELPENATDEQIKEQYRELAKKYHPDINKEPDATSKFQQIAEAYDWLTNEQPITIGYDFTPQESDYERRKREFLQKKYEKEKAAKEKALQIKKRNYIYIRSSAYLTLFFAIILFADNLITPAQSNEILQIKYQFMKSRRDRTYEDHWITNKSDVTVPYDAYFDFEEGKEITVFKTRILNVAKKVVYPKDAFTYYFETPNIYDYYMILPILILLSSYFPIKNKEFQEEWLYAGYSALGFSLLAILILVT